MKLYYSPGACSLSPHIALREAELPFELHKVALQTKLLDDGTDFRTINPKGYVPALALPDGQILTEGPAIVQYIADRVPTKHLAPANGTLERYRLQEWLNFISTEIHKQFSPLFNPSFPTEQKAELRTRIGSRFDLIAPVVENHTFLTGERFTVADGYLFTVLRWAKGTEIDLTPWPGVLAYMKRIGERPAVRAAINAEKPN
jgi:glutathione S-transferase